MKSPSPTPSPPPLGLGINGHLRKKVYKYTKLCFEKRKAWNGCFQRKKARYEQYFYLSYFLQKAYIFFEALPSVEVNYFNDEIARLALDVYREDYLKKKLFPI